MERESTKEKLKKVNFKKSKLNKKNALRVSVVVGVIVIPLLYSYFYLGAFWDPYSRLETLPVAVVNNDEGAVINDEERNLGQEICDQLADDGTLKFVFTDEKDATDGTNGDDYYAMITIPENFSADIASAGTTDKKTATITYSPNEKRNYLASQILSRAVLEIEESVRSSVDSEITQQLVDKLNAVPDQMTELQDGLTKLSDGTTQLSDGTTKLSDGASTLADGTSEFYNSFKKYAAGVTSVKEGSNTLNSGITTLDTGITALLAGANQLTTSTENINAIHTGAASLATGAGTFYTYLVQYTTGVDTLIASAGTTSTFLTNLTTNTAWPTIAGSLTTAAGSGDAAAAATLTYLSQASANKAATTASLATLSAASASLKTAAAQIKSGADALNNGTAGLADLKAALIQIQAGLQTAKDGSTKLAAGSSTLYAGISDLNTATAKLSAASSTIASGASDLSTGADTLNSGVTDVKDGVDEMKSGVDTSITDMNADLPALNGLADYVSDPVDVVTDSVTTVPNYGTAFAPYFLSLSLWVGGLIIFVGIYYDPDNKFRILSRESEHKMARSFIYLLIGFTQAIVLGILLLFGLGLKVANIPLYFLSCCLVSLVFISMIQFFMVYLKDLGKFISMVLLILQLTSCGGTFPMETVPKMFNVLYPFMPMTYSVGLFKNSISGVDTQSTLYNAGILTAILAVFLVLTLVFSAINFKKNGGQLSDLKNNKTEVFPKAV